MTAMAYTIFWPRPIPNPRSGNRTWPRRVASATAMFTMFTKEAFTVRRLQQAGQITFAVIARNSTNEPNRLIAASIGAALPADNTNYGYLSEHHPFGQTEKVAGEYAEDLAATMLATTLGVEFNPDTDWSERENIYKMSGKIVRSFNITQSAEGDKNGLWTTVLACGILLP